MAPFSRRALMSAAVALAAGWPQGAGAEMLRRGQGGRLFLPARIAGQAVEALLDSGAEMTLVDLGLARQLGLGQGDAAQVRGSGAGQQAARIVPDVAVAAAGVDLGRIPVVVMDLGDVGRRLIGGPLPMVLGREFFDAARLRIDLVRGEVQPVGRDREPAGVRLPLTPQHGIETMPILVEGRPVQAEFDLGNGSRMMIGRAFAERAGLLQGRALGEETGGGIGGATRRTTLTLAEVTIAGRVFRNVPAAIADGEKAADANVGVSLLQDFRIVCDYREAAIWLQATA